MALEKTQVRGGMAEHAGSADHLLQGRQQLSRRLKGKGSQSRAQQELLFLHLSAMCGSHGDSGQHACGKGWRGTEEQQPGQAKGMLKKSLLMGLRAKPTSPV